MTDGALAGLRVIDAATLAAGPLIATWMGEHGAEVIKVEQPDGGDPLRQWGAQRDGIGLMWKSVARNKKCVTLNLRLEAGRDLLRSLTRQADVVIMNLRPSTMRKWGLEYESLAADNPKLVMVHVTGYGAGGPKSDWPGFGTLGEAMSGFAHLTGTPDGPPTLPSFMLADGVAGLTATYAVMMALYHRDTRGGIRAADRHQPDRTAGPAARAVGADLRPARHDPGQDRQPVGHQRTAQHLPDQRRPLAGDVRQRPHDRDARAAGGRPAGADRGPEVRRGAAAAAERGRDRRDHGGLDRPAHAGRRPWPSSRRRASRPRRSTTPSSCSTTRSCGRAASTRRSPTRNSARCGSRRRFPASPPPRAPSPTWARGSGSTTPRSTVSCSASTTAACAELHEQGVI